MKLAKLFSALLICTALLFTINVTNVSSENLPKKKTQNLLKDLKISLSVYYEYQEINGVMWVFVYDDDGKLLECHPEY